MSDYSKDSLPKHLSSVVRLDGIQSQELFHMLYGSASETTR